MSGCELHRQYRDAGPKMLATLWTWMPDTDHMLMSSWTLSFWGFHATSISKLLPIDINASFELENLHRQGN
jgi:hypothetical protein